MIKRHVHVRQVYVRCFEQVMYLVPNLVPSLPNQCLLCTDFELIVGNICNATLCAFYFQQATAAATSAASFIKLIRSPQVGPHKKNG